MPLAEHNNWVLNQEILSIICGPRTTVSAPRQTVFPTGYITLRNAFHISSVMNAKL
jgi:hypothetical protein